MSSPIKYWSGNLVQYKDLPTIKPERRGKIIPLTLDDLLALDEGYRVVEPIPLTELWLKQLGFNYFGVGPFLSKYWLYYVGESVFSIKVDESIDVLFKIDEYDSGSVVYRDLHYVHQLQNIVCVLTCHELQIKCSNESAQ